MGTTILTLAFVAIVMFIVLAIYTAGKNRKKPVGYEVTVPDGETHLVRRQGYIYWYGQRELSNQYLRYPDDRVIVLQGDDNRFKLVLDNGFVFSHFGSTLVKIKVKIEAFLRLDDLEKLFKYGDMMVLKLYVKSVASNACREMKLKELLKSGVSEVIAKDAILEKQSDFYLAGLSCSILRLAIFKMPMARSMSSIFAASWRVKKHRKMLPNPTKKHLVIRHWKKWWIKDCKRCRISKTPLFDFFKHTGFFSFREKI